MNAPACRSKWKVEPLGQAVEILDSRRVPVNSEERKKRVGKIPYYGATGQVGWINDYLFDEELVLLGEDGAPFLDSSKSKAYLIRGKSWINNHAHVLRAKPGLLNSFLLYQLNCTDYGPYVSGTTRLKLPQGPMKQILLLIPDEDEQREIVAEIEKQFTRLEAGVAGLRRVQANLKRYRAAVLKSACEGKLVSNEAELARQEGRIYETGAQLLERILIERRQKWNGKGSYKAPVRPETSRLPKLPEGWMWATVEQVNLANRPCAYGVLQPGEDIDAGVPFVRVGDISNGRVEIEDLKRISPTIAAQYPRTKLSGGEFAITLVGAIGRTAIIPKMLAGGNVARAVGIVPLTESINAHWIEIWFRNPIKISEMVSKSHEVARKTLNLEDVRAATIAMPPIAEQERIVGEVERRLSVVEELEAVTNANLRRATRLRQSILQRAFQEKLFRAIPANRTR